MIFASGKKLAFWQWRFSLRALFIMITVVAVLLGGELHLLREQQQVIGELFASRSDKTIGTQIWVRYGESKWPWIDRYFDEHFLDAVKVVQIDQLTDSEARQLCHLRDLQILDIESDLLTDEGIRALRNLKSLHDLHVGTTQVTQDSMRALGLALPQTRIYWDDGHDLFGLSFVIYGAKVSKVDNVLVKPAR